MRRLRPLKVEGRKLHELLSLLPLGAVFIAAGTGRILHPGEFAGVISNYQILPSTLGRPGS